MKNFFFLLILVFLGKFPAYAQQKTQADIDRQKIQEATFIFEGDVVNTDGYFNADRSRVFRSSIIHINQSLRGKLQAGTVQVVYKGPRVAAIIKDPKTGETMVQVPEDNGHGNADNQGITLPKGKPILFFCRPLPASFEPSPKRLSTENTVTLEVVGLAFDIFRNNTILSDIGGKFENQQELYHYLNKTYQVPLPAAERVLTPLQVDSAGRENHRQAELMDKRVREIKAAKEKKAKSRNRSGAFAPQTTQELTFTIRNPVVSGTTTRYLDYDVFIQSNSGGSYFSLSNMEFSYNTTAFGSALGTTGNSQVTATRGSTFPASTYRQPNVVDGNDPTTPTFRVLCGVIVNGTGFNRTWLTSTPVQLVHLRIQISNCVASSGIAFVNTVDMADYDFFSTSGTASEQSADYINYDPVTYTNYAGGITLCSSPTITNFTPAVQAGTGSSGNSLLTITGTGFGSARGTVELKDADVGGTQYMALDDYDIQSWSDTQIQVRVPGTVSVGTRTSQAGIPLSGTCGSGRIKVRSAAGAAAESPLSLGDLDVEYALSQSFYTTPGATVYHKARRYLAKNNCADGFTFRVDNTLRNDVNAIKVIESALSTWSVRLGVYLALERNAQGGLVSQVNMSAQADGVNSLFYDVLTGNTLMRTTTNTLPCGSGTTLKIETYDADIAINVGSTWDYSLEGNVQGESFLSAFLHELGHALGLAHVVTPNTAANLQQELMYFQTNASPVAANRQSLTSGRSEAVAAALNVTAQSRLQTWCDPNVQSFGSTGTAACRVTAPLAPGLQAQANSGISRTITLTWNAIYNATGYMIQSSVNPTTGFTDYQAIFSGTTDTYTTGILDPLMPYYFRIKATNVAGSSPYSNVASATTAARLSPKPLAAPTALQGATFNSGQLSNYLTWNYATTGASFVVTRSTTIDFQNATQYATGVDVHDYTDTDITPGTVYFYRVYAQVSGNDSDDTAPISLTATGCTPLGLIPANSSLFGSAIRLNSNQRSFFLNRTISGATSYTWNLNPPVEDAGGWVIYGQSWNGAAVDYVGSFPYTGPVTSLVVTISDNCGTTVVRTIDLGSPTDYGSGSQPVERGMSGSLANIALYPNPAQKQMHLTLPANVETSHIRLLDLKTGIVLKEWQGKTATVDADLQGVLPGIYLLEVNALGQVQRLRLEVAP